MLKHFGDSKNHRGSTDAKFNQEGKNKSKTLKLIKINYFSLRSSLEL